MGLFDLEKQFAFYGAYHSNPLNILIHMIFVWPILFTVLVLLYFTPPLFEGSTIGLGGQSLLVLNDGFLFTLIYSVYYVSLDRKAGSLAALLVLLCWVGSSALSHHLGFSLAWKLKGKQKMAGRPRAEQDDHAADVAQEGSSGVAGWGGKIGEQFGRIKKHAETYPYVWGSYILVYGGFSLWLTYRWRKLRRTEDNVRVLSKTETGTYS